MKSRDYILIIPEEPPSPIVEALEGLTPKEKVIILRRIVEEHKRKAKT